MASGELHGEGKKRKKKEIEKLLKKAKRQRYAQEKGKGMEN